LAHTISSEGDNTIETVTYSKIGLEDLETSTRREVRLADGRVVTISPVDMGYFLSNRSALASMPAPGVPNRLWRVTDDIRGLWYDTGAQWVRVGGRTYDVQEFGVLPTNTAAQNDAALAVLLAALPSTGARIVFPAATTTYKFATTLAPTVPVQLVGHGPGRTAGGGRQTITALEYQGSGVAISLSGSAVAGSVLSHFELKHSGTGTVGIQVDNTNMVFLDTISCVLPSVQFSTAGISLAPSNGCFALLVKDCFFRASGPVGVRVNEVQAFTVIRGGMFRGHSTAQIQIGPTSNCFETHILEAAIEGNSAGHGVQILRGEGVCIDHCHFEISASMYGVDIPSTATKAENVQIRNSHFTYLEASAVTAVSVNLSSAQVWVEGCRTRNNSGGTVYLVTNTSSAFVRVLGNQLDTSTTALSNPTNARSGENFLLGTGQVDGFDVRLLEKSAFFNGNSGAGEDTMRSYTLPGGTVDRAHRGIRYTAFGRCAANGNNKRIRLYFDGQTVWDSGTVAANDTGWHVDATILRFDATTVHTLARGQINSTEMATQVSELTLVTAWTSDIIVLLTGEATNNNDVRTWGHTIELIE
jgi:hypothetical protein